MSDPLKQVALDLAIKSGCGATAADIVEAARKFHAFLSGGAIDLHDAAIVLRCPEGFEAFFAALGLADTTENRGRVDDAFKDVAAYAQGKIRRSVQPLVVDWDQVFPATDEGGGP